MVQITHWVNHNFGIPLKINVLEPLMNYRLDNKENCLCFNLGWWIWDGWLSVDGKYWTLWVMTNSKKERSRVGQTCIKVKFGPTLGGRDQWEGCELGDFEAQALGWEIRYLLISAAIHYYILHPLLYTTS